MLRHLILNRSGSAAAEMALVTPLLMVLMFGSFEMGNYFYDNHIVSKAVRDGARYASRRSFSQYSCSTVSTDVIDKTRNVTRTGQIASGGSPRFPSWSDPTTITVSVRCDTSGSYGSFYTGMAGGVPVVQVSAVVPYGSLLGMVGFNATGLNILANSEVPVMGQ